jgi:hypothetical protein
LDHRKKLAALAALALCAGCATARWSVVQQFRTPGEKLETFPEQVWDEYDCDSQKRPFLVIEKNELTPQRVIAGGNFGHRLVYVMCPALPTAVVEGTLATRIHFKGQPIVQQMDSHYDIKPGRWTVDAFVHLPDDAEAGVYAYELEFESEPLLFKKSLTFVVKTR